MSSIATLDNIWKSNGNSPNEWTKLDKVLRDSPQELPSFSHAFSTKLQNFGIENQLLLLDIIDYLVDQGSIPLLKMVSSKEFLLLLLNLWKTKSSQDVQCKILSLIKKWGENFVSQSTTLPNFSEMYKSLLKNGVVFPIDYQSTYSRYVGNNQSISTNSSYQQRHQREGNEYSSDFNNNRYSDDAEKNLSDNNYDEFNYAENIKVSLNPSKYEQKYSKLVNYMISMVENISWANDIIDNSKPDSKVDEALREVCEVLRSGNNRLIEIISGDKLQDEKLMELSLGVSEDINRSWTRYSTLKEKRKPEPFLSYFVEKNAMNDIPIAMKSENKKSSGMNNQGSNRNNSNMNNNNNGSNVQMRNVSKPDPNIKSADDLFDIFSNPVPVVNNNNMMYNSNQVNGNQQLPQNTQKNPTDMLQENWMNVYSQESQYPVPNFIVQERNMPPMGNNMPPMGNNMPPMGNNMPQMGNNMPQMGNNMPPMGNNMPPITNNMNNIMPPIGNNMNSNVQPNINNLYNKESFSQLNPNQNPSLDPFQNMGHSPIMSTNSNNMNNPGFNQNPNSFVNQNNHPLGNNNQPQYLGFPMNNMQNSQSQYEADKLKEIDRLF